MIYNSRNNETYLNPFFEAFFGKDTANVGYLPLKTDIYESEKAYRLDVELPGFEKENINIDYKDGYLTVSVKTVPTKDEEFKLIRRERFSGETSREFYLGDVDENNISATYVDGILSITAMKLQPVEAKPLKIEIK
ncbi:MAG: Hsp20/alpha crystallin family protein [Bacilli bacterium]|nr:Hsp20/alpha crystallin family protein [Bacilli bacterium]